MKCTFIALIFVFITVILIEKSHCLPVGAATKTVTDVVYEELLNLHDENKTDFRNNVSVAGPESTDDTKLAGENKTLADCNDENLSLDMHALDCKDNISAISVIYGNETDFTNNSSVAGPANIDTESKNSPSPNVLTNGDKDVDNVKVKPPLDGLAMPTESENPTRVVTPKQDTDLPTVAKTTTSTVEAKETPQFPVEESHPKTQTPSNLHTTVSQQAEVPPPKSTPEVKPSEKTKVETSDDKDFPGGGDEDQSDIPVESSNDGLPTDGKKETDVLPIDDKKEDPESITNEKQPVKTQSEQVDSHDKKVADALPRPVFPEQENGHFFVYFMTVVAICVLGYFLFHNKQKIIALIVEGRHDRRRRAHTYRKLENEGTKGSPAIF